MLTPYFPGLDHVDLSAWIALVLHFPRAKSRTDSSYFNLTRDGAGHTADDSGHSVMTITKVANPYDVWQKWEMMPLTESLSRSLRAQAVHATVIHDCPSSMGNLPFRLDNLRTPWVMNLSRLGILEELLQWRRRTSWSWLSRGMGESPWKIYNHPTHHFCLEFIELMPDAPEAVPAGLSIPPPEQLRRYSYQRQR